MNKLVGYFRLFIIKSPFVIASFAFVLRRCKQRRHREKPMPLKWRAS